MKLKFLCTVMTTILALTTGVTATSDPNNPEGMGGCAAGDAAKNKQVVMDFYQEVFGDKNVDAIDKFIDAEFIQHNPMIADGRDALKTVLKGWFEGAPKEKITFLRISAEGDLVWVHTKVTIVRRFYSIIEIFRLKNGKLVEHWDVLQVRPQVYRNPHPLF